MRPALRWLLLLTLVLSAGAVWWPPSGAPPLVIAVQRDVDRAQSAGAATAAADEGRARGEQPVLPAMIPVMSVDLARRDIFAPAAQGGGLPGAGKAELPGRPLPAAPPPMAMVQPAPAVHLAPPVAAAPVPLQLRYLGSMLTPAGERLVLVARGDTAYIARPGLSVEGGYAIQSIEANAVRVVHSSSGNVTDIPIPTALHTTQAPR